MQNSSNNNTFNTFVTYEQNGLLILGVILNNTGGVSSAQSPKDSNKSKIKVINENNSTVELTNDRINVLKSKDKDYLEKLNTCKSSDYPKILKEIKELAYEKSQTINILDIWEFTKSEEKEYSESDLAEIYFTKLDLISELALRLKLTTEKIYFKRVKNLFVPRDAEVVNQLKIQYEVEEKKQKQREILVNFFKEFLTEEKRSSLIEVESVINKSPELKSLISVIEKVAALGDNAETQEVQEAKKILILLEEALNLNLKSDLQEACFQLLFRIGYFSLDTNLSLIRYKLLDKFSAETEKETVSIIDKAKSKLDTKEVLDVFSIDDESTQDVDDAFSLVEEIDGSYLLGIHITNVADYIQQESSIFNEIQKIATSTYLPEKVFHMLPRELSLGVLSLLPNENRQALSIFCKITEVSNNNSLLIDFKEIKQVTVCNKQKLSYEYVDSQINKGNKIFNLLKRIAETLESNRYNTGAIKVNKREVEVYRDEKGKLSLLTVDEKTPARSLVGELMVLYNSTIAKYCEEKEIPCIYRTQDSPEENSEEDQKYPISGPARDFYTRVKLKRSIIQTTAGVHSTLGLTHYTQVTSPLRRFLDLVIQQQILEYLNTGLIKYKSEDLLNYIKETEEPLNRSNFLSRETKKFWILRYLESRTKKNPNITGTIVKVDGRSPLVELDEVFIVAPIYVPNKEAFDREKKEPKEMQYAELQNFISNLKLGDSVNLKITKIIARSDYLRVEVRANFSS